MNDPKARFESKADSARLTINKFLAKMMEDPAYALCWSDEVFQAAARLKVAKQIISFFEGNFSAQQAREYVMDEVLCKSKYPAHSTSPASNLMEQYILAAYAEAVQALEQFEE